MIPKRAGSFLILLPVLLAAQSQVPAQGPHQAAQIAVLQQKPVSPSRPAPFKSPVMQRLWASTRKHKARVMNQPSDPVASPFLTIPPMYAAGSSPFDLALGDFNSDGKQDVIVAANPPLLFLGNGDGTLQAAAAIGTISSTPMGVAVGDFNRDGSLDVVFAISGGAVVYLGNGNGTLGAGTTFSSGGTNQSSFAGVLVADVNNDGISDLILNTDAGVSVLLGNGNGTFRSPISSPGTVRSMAAADFNKDGYIDLAVTDGSSSLSIMLSKGDGTFVVKSTYLASGYLYYVNAIAVADYNRDGFLDVALPSGQVFLGNGDGTLTTTTNFPTVSQARYLVAVDVNGDGNVDLLTVNTGSSCGLSDWGTVGVSLGNGDGTFQSVTEYDSGGCGGTPWGTAGIGDLNNDGAHDLVVLSGDSEFGDTPQLSVLINEGNGTFPAAVLNISGGSGGVAVDDFNHDGNADVALADGSVYLGNGNGILRLSASTSLGGIAVASGDFNHDGKADLAAAVECALAGCSTGGQLLIAAGNGDGTFQTPTALPSGGFYAESLAVADFNNDGNVDVALVNNCTDSGCSAEGSVSTYLGNGNGTFSLLNTISTTSGFPTSIVAGDFNNDGAIDLAVGFTSFNFGPPPLVNVLLGNGDGTFQPPIVFNAHIRGITDGITAVVTKDFNNDGILDLVLAFGGSADGGESGSTMYGSGDGTFIAGPIILSGAPQFSVVAADFSGTGTLTPIFANRCGDALDCFAGSLLNAAAPDIMLQFLGVGDFNNDGKPDLVGSLQYDAGVSVLVNTGTTLAATTTTLSPSASRSYSAFQPVSFTTQIQHTGPGTPTGTMQFFDSGVSIGSASVDSNGQASLTTSGLDVGAHFVVAYYQGDSVFATSNSLGVHVTINKASPALALSSSLNPSAAGQTVTLTATITPPYGGQATGSIAFSDGSTTLGSAMVSANVASLTTSALSVGTHSIVAVYGGDSNFSSSTSAPLSQVVVKATTTTTLVSSLNPSVKGRPVTFTAAVSPQSGGGTPTGKVRYLNGTTLLATVPLTSGTARYTTSKLPPGINRITAVYAGNSNDSASTSLPVNQFVLAATTNTLTSTPNPSVYGQSVLFSATITSSIGSPPDGETVTFKQGATVLGTGVLSGGTATLSTSTLDRGAKAITVGYAGDANFSGCTSRAVRQVIR